MPKRKRKLVAGVDFDPAIPETHPLWIPDSELPFLPKGPFAYTAILPSSDPDIPPLRVYGSIPKADMARIWVADMIQLADEQNLWDKVAAIRPKNGSSTGIDTQQE